MQNIQGLQNNIKWSNTYVIGILEKEEKVYETKEIFEEIMAVVFEK